MLALASPQTPDKNAQAATQTAAMPTATATPVPPDKVGVLVLVVDDRMAVKPNLLGCWVITFKPGLHQYFLFGFPVDTPVNTHYSMRDYFEAGLRGQSLEQSSVFMEDALGKLGLPILYRVFLDEAAVAQLIDSYGGLALDPGQPPVTGEAAVARHANFPAEDQQTRIAFQQAALKAFTDLVREQPWPPAEERLLALYTTYQLLSPDAPELLNLARQVQLQDADFSISIATLPR